MFCAPETANPLLDWGKKTRLAPVVESLVSNVQTTIFLSKISEKLPLRLGVGIVVAAIVVFIGGFIKGKINQ